MIYVKRIVAVSNNIFCIIKLIIKLIIIIYSMVEHTSSYYIVIINKCIVGLSIHGINYNPDIFDTPCIFDVLTKIRDKYNSDCDYSTIRPMLIQIVTLYITNNQYDLLAIINNFESIIKWITNDERT
jgi:hypothetical protein